MKLSELDLSFLTVVRDGEFHSLGALGDSRDRMMVRIESAEFLPRLELNEQISCVLCPAHLATEVSKGFGVAIADDSMEAFFRLHNYLALNNFYCKPFPNEIADDARIHPTAVIGEHSVRIGSGSVIGPHVTIHEGSLLGDQIVLRHGCVIGTEGFYFKRVGDTILPVIHAGGVELGDRVEIQANSAICKGIFGDNTSIGHDTKIDNLVHVAHSAVIGARCLIAASALISGCCEVGDDVWIGPGSVISNGLRIGNGARISLGSVVAANIRPRRHVTGNFAVDHETFLETLYNQRKVRKS